MQTSVIFVIVAAFFIAVKSESAYEVQSVNDYYQKVSDANGKLVVVDFFSKSCGSCDYIAPHMERFAQKYATQIIVLRVDVDEQQELARRYHIKSLPQTVYLKGRGLIAYELYRANPSKIESIIKYLLTHK